MVAPFLRSLSTLPLVQLTLRDIQSRFAGSAMGVLWVIGSPLIMLFVYTLVFGSVFQARISAESAQSYVQFVAVALWPWMMFSDGISRGITAITSNANLVKKLAFPNHYLICAAVTSAWVIHLAGFVVVLFVLAAFGMPVALDKWPVAIIALVALFVLTLAASTLLAALNVVLRDIETVVFPALTLLYFLTPILYPLSAIPANLQPFLAWNPLVPIVNSLRGSLMGSTTDPLATLGWPALLVFAVIVLGAWHCFKRLSNYFEDFL